MLNHFIMLHGHCGKTNQQNKVVKDLTGGNHDQLLQVLEDFRRVIFNIVNGTT